MTEEHGPWTIEETEQKYENSFIQVREDKVLQPDGKPGSYATIEIKPGIAILPIDRDRNVYLTRQFRYALGQDSIEVVCGAIDNNEPPLTAAKREIEEEIGIKAEELIELGFFDLDTSIVHCPVHLFLTQKFTFTEPHQDGTERIETVYLSLEQAVEMVMNSQITHAPSCVLILKAAQKISNQ